ncbi:hypothetical protein BG004_007151 [Podila humilis]|nr:hypothetical protein BG004_007151 [Podila humilis]
MTIISDAVLRTAIILAIISLVASAASVDTSGMNNSSSSASPPAAQAFGGGGGEVNQTDHGKVVGLSLAIGSGLLIGASFVFKKKGLINCTKHGMLAGEGHAYLKSVMWWTGMIMMIVGEVFNFVAYAFVQPILVTPLGALSVVICAILSSIFLRERLTLQGKVGCAQCIVGATIIVLHAPEQTSVKTIQEFQHYMVQPIFLTWMFIIIIASLVLVFKAGPRWGKQHMMIYISVCSLIGSLSVVATQGLGAAIVHNISTGEPQFNNWFIYFVIVFMVVTLLTEINYLNKALNLFNTAMVTPTYYVTFTSTTIITSAILYQGFSASVVAILTVCLGFLTICGGVLLLQTSKPVVPLHIPGGSSIDGVVLSSTLTYDDIEPNAADMRASPFSSIRRITRDLRQQPSFITANGTHLPFHSSPLNPNIPATSGAAPAAGSRASDNLLNRKRRASNAAQRSRPGSVLFGPGSGALAHGTNGPVSAFYPSAAGAYSTIVMGPNGSQVRLQLCEIVVADEKNETSRYQVYRPMPSTESNYQHHDSVSALNEKGGESYNSGNARHPSVVVTNATGFKAPLLAPRGSLLTDSRSSSLRFSFNNHSPSRVSLEDGERDSEVVSHPSSPIVAGGPTSDSPTVHSSAISGSLFVPPKVAISPPTPVIESLATMPDSLAPATSSLVSHPPGTPIDSGENIGLSVPGSSSSPTAPAFPSSGPLAPGGSFFTRPPKFRSPSTCTAASTGDIMEINEPGHGRTVVSIEPVQQQPLYSIYVPPPPSTQSSPLRNNKDGHHAFNLKRSLIPQVPANTAAVGAPAVLKLNDPHSNDDSEKQVESQKDGNPAEETSSSSLTSLMASADAKPKRRLFGNLFGGGGGGKGNSGSKIKGNKQKKTTSGDSPKSTSSAAALIPISMTNASPGGGRGGGEGEEHHSSTEQTTGPGPMAFNRTNHPTRISEGEEEEDTEETI